MPGVPSDVKCFFPPHRVSPWTPASSLRLKNIRNTLMFEAIKQRLNTHGVNTHQSFVQMKEINTVIPNQRCVLSN